MSNRSPYDCGSTAKELSEYEPDWVSPPGHTIKDILRERRLSRAFFSQQVGLSLEQITDLFNGKMEISEEFAKKLGDLFGNSEKFWVSREWNYVKDLERQGKQRGDE